MFPSRPGRSLAFTAAPSLNPYSSAAQTNVVVSYRDIPTAFVGEGALLPSLDPRGEVCVFGSRGI